MVGFTGGDSAGEEVGATLRVNNAEFVRIRSAHDKARRLDSQEVWDEVFSMVTTISSVTFPSIAPKSWATLGVDTTVAMLVVR